ncbi:hypothetical protein AVEN_158582-1 [Araneus ventricosus]|uniref:Uncharacterized protein n=1 Tax=Araneus ventricosus TaxID=182803 RepID=A0A4Y2JMK5_ARAVE|nr:hypothetical protein AVEN_158582-1 [Araneus ventricosus]
MPGIASLDEIENFLKGANAVADLSTSHCGMIYPPLKDEEVQRKFGNAEQNLFAWHINAGNYQQILHFLLYKEENAVRDLFNKFRSWEVSLSIFSACPHLAQGSIGDGEMLGVFLLPEALLQTFFRNKRLWMFAEKKIYISPVEYASRKVSI